MRDADDEAGSGLPPSLEAAWGLRERPGKGPRPGLTVDRIVAAAVGLAAAEGLAAVSMGRVAKEVGVSTMALYRYVSAKDELYVLMQEAVLGPPPAAVPGRGWRAALTAWAHAQREMLQRHVWALRMPITGPPATPNSVAWMEAGLTALDGSGLDDGERISVVMLVGGHVRSDVLLMADLGAGHAASGLTPEESLGRYARLLRRFTDPARFPAVTRALASGVFDGADDPDHEFRFGLERILDGVEAMAAERGGPGLRPGTP
ncbi:TetR/AcrR family transcriptional regulator [Streptomyces sp. NPDC060194]|uniref:TetR/AcrR family transcriptional regulator n=1 Tax=Streptomyces sp. NPDC060194 TaxID=3347069 RepID=UPI0036647E61